MVKLAYLPAGRQARRFKMMDYYVYIIRGENNAHYAGMTNDIARRLHQHELGQNQTTKRFSAMKLIHVEVCNNRSEARKTEMFFKSGFGREIIAELEHLPGW